jgi:hypothetical protein
MAIVKAAPPPPRADLPPPTLARSVSAPPAYRDFGALFGVPVLRIEATLPAERVEYDESFASDDEVTK